MNLKRIIREEINDFSDSFYLIVSGDEKYIYGSIENQSHAGNRFRPIKDYTIKDVVNSKYISYKQAEHPIEWSKSQLKNGVNVTMIELAKSILKYNPKIITMDLILNKRNDNFPMIESEGDEWEWAKTTQPIELEDPEDWIGRSFGYGQKIIDQMDSAEIELHDDEEIFTILGVDENGNLPLLKYHPIYGENYDSSTSPRNLRHYINKGLWVWT